MPVDSKQAVEPAPAGVRIVNLSERRTAKSTLLSAELITALDDRLKRGEQAIILLDRRGFAPMALCTFCRESVHCESCSTGMTYHKTLRLLVCHLCGFNREVPEVCPACGKRAMELTGVGTQKLEEELVEYFPEARIRRFDRDSVRSERERAAILREFADRRADFLLGTRMVAKGHDFAGVTLAAAPMADHGLNLPDFRATERTRQLLVQAAGRAGRRDLPGEVLIQTFQPRHYVFRNLGVEPDHEFIKRELAARWGRFPPYVRLIAVRLSSPDEAEGLRVIREVADRLRAVMDRARFQGVEMLGPSPAPLEKIKDRYRFMLLLRSKDLKVLRGVVTTAKAEGVFEVERVMRLVLDVDPNNML